MKRLAIARMSRGIDKIFLSVFFLQNTGAHVIYMKKHIK
jgi:hypothetical protein